MGSERGSLINKGERYFLIVGAIYFIGSVLLGIFNAALYYISTNDWRPLVYATGGRMFTADVSVADSIAQLKNPVISVEFAKFLKQNILTSLLLIVVFSYFTYIAFKWFVAAMSNQASAEHLKFWSKIFLGFGAIIIVGILSACYSFLILDRSLSESLPFQGVISLIYDEGSWFSNMALFKNSVGTYSSFSLTNSTIPPDMATQYSSSI